MSYRGVIAGITVVTGRAFNDIAYERMRQDAKWGEQNHPDGTDGGAFFAERRDYRRKVCQAYAAEGTVTWRHILDEEVHEAYAETDTAKLRQELVEVAAVAVAWIEAIDRRTATQPTPPTPEANDVPR